MTGHAAHLLAAQNRDGGWAYVHGTSWTEPTAWALLALRAGGLENDNYTRGLRWLRRTQQSDGGWPPQPGVSASTWVTALGLLVCADLSAAGDCQAALHWVMSAAERGSGFIERVRTFLLDQTPEPGAGWSFFPQTAGWILPTAASILALERVHSARNDAAIASRIGAGRTFLLHRKCADGGWNHGSSAAMGYAAGSYPETTGMALLALHGSGGIDLDRSLAVAERHLAQCRSAEGRAWLELALRGYGRAIENTREPDCHTNTDHALLMLARGGDGLKRFLTL